MRIGTILGAGTGSLLFLCLVIGTVAYVQNSSVREKLDELTSVREPVNLAAHILKKHVVEATSATLGYFMTGDTALRAALKRSEGEFMNLRDTLHPLLSAAGETRSASGLVEGLTRYYALAAAQTDLRDEQARRIQQLLGDLDAIDGLLKNRIQASVRSDDPIAFRRLQVALELQIQMNAMMKGLGNFLLTGEERFQRGIDEARQSYSHFVEVYQVVLLSSEEKRWAAELIRRSDRILTLASSVAEMQSVRSSQMAAFMKQYEELGSLIDDPLVRNTSASLAVTKRELTEAGDRANSTIMAVLLAGMLFGIGAAFVTTRKITSPLQNLISGMNEVDREGHAREIRLRSGEEFRQVGESFNSMVRRLARANEEQKELQRQLAAAEEERLQSLRTFARSVQQAQEEERSRIARELHDDICQRLTGLKYHVEALEEEARPSQPRAARRLREVRHELDRSVVEVRRISSNLRPSVLDDFGLATALQILCKDFQKSHRIRTDLQVDPILPGRIDPASETAIFRIIQQAFANIAQHSGARSAFLSLRAGGDQLELRIADDGRGFSPPAAGRHGNGIGLASMRERAELLGGSFSISSDPRSGTTVLVTIPMRKA
jgi:signal transduction histidine kinase